MLLGLSNLSLCDRPSLLGTQVLLDSWRVPEAGISRFPSSWQAPALGWGHSSRTGSSVSSGPPGHLFVLQGGADDPPPRPSRATSCCSWCQLLGGM